MSRVLHKGEGYGRGTVRAGLRGRLRTYDSLLRRTNFTCCGVTTPLDDYTVLRDKLWVTVGSPENSAARTPDLISALNA